MNLYINVKYVLLVTVQAFRSGLARLSHRSKFHHFIFRANQLILWQRDHISSLLSQYFRAKLPYYSISLRIAGSSQAAPKERPLYKKHATSSHCISTHLRD